MTFREVVSVRDCNRSSIFLCSYSDVSIRHIKAVNLKFSIQGFSFGPQHSVVGTEAVIDKEFN